jgi:hypothetical protein
VGAINWIFMDHTILYDPESTSQGTDRGKDKLSKQDNSNSIVGIHLQSREFVLGSHTIHHDLGVVTRENNNTIYELSISQ